PLSPHGAGPAADARGRPRARAGGDARDHRRGRARERRLPPERAARRLMSWAAVLVALAALAVQAWRTRRTVAGLEQRLAAAHRELEGLQRAFERFAPAEVVEHVIAEGISARSEKKEVTVLFADLKGFTELGEGLAPAELVTIPNGYLARMRQALVD